jgi:hypothetical protein
MSFSKELLCAFVTEVLFLTIHLAVRGVNVRV